LTIPRIYLPHPLAVGAVCGLGDEDRRYVKSVLRLRKNDHLVLFDGSGCEYQALIREAKDDRLSVEILKKDAVSGKAFRITLSQALPKSGKMDFIIQKATELGVDKIIPFESLRSVPRITADRRIKKGTRWRKIAVEAARQCGRVDIPEINDSMDFQAMLQCAPPGALRIIFWEEETKIGIRKALRQSPAATATDLFIVVGPEGGFAKEEIARAVAAGFQSVSLGRRILRVETAALAILSIIQYEKGTLGSPDDGDLIDV
jgi:16S rRNA (uracil1498-N3)-methyltransferase